MPTHYDSYFRSSTKAPKGDCSDDVKEEKKLAKLIIKNIHNMVPKVDLVRRGKPLNLKKMLRKNKINYSKDQKDVSES